MNEAVKNPNLKTMSKSKFPPLPRSFYARSPLKVAPDLLGKILCHEKKGTLTSGRIVEVEAYLGLEDPASHAYRGETPRTKIMFGPPGFVYVYFSYGSHFCMNLVTGKDGVASAVLIRALEPLEGVDIMKRRRKKQKLMDLTSGPGKLTKALGIQGKQNGLDITQKPLWIYEDRLSSSMKWARSPRVGVSRATKRLYRFYVKNSEFISRKG